MENALGRSVRVQALCLRVEEYDTELDGGCNVYVCVFSEFSC